MERSLSNMCRCCASEGAFKDIKTTYRWMGEDEVYGDMLKDCFGITLSAVDVGEGGICEVCITQLRNAANFKKQVLHAEEQFTKEMQNKFFKPNIVKVELPVDDVLDSDDNNISGDDAFSGTDYDIPIKTETVEEPKSKKRLAAKASTSRSKKQKNSDEEDAPVKRKPKVEPIAKKYKIIITTKKHYEAKPANTKSKVITFKKSARHLLNIREILNCTNATPIGRFHVIGFSCCYCDEKFKEPALLKEHTLTVHKDTTQARFMKKSLRDFLVKLDITSMQCRLCYSSIESIDQAVKHLKAAHKKNLLSDMDNHIIPFKFNSEMFRCCICETEFGKFKPLLLHMDSHYRNHECNICGAGFINESKLANHKRTHETGEFKCELCPKVFNSNQKRKMHEKIHTDKKLHKCPYCLERFCNNKYKSEHMAKEHGIPLPVYKCNACDRMFTDSTRYGIHMRKDHLMDKPHKCSECDKAFFSWSKLKNHIISHSGERAFHCQVCLKSYGRRKTLREHMRIHNNDRRFKCEHCGQAFVQKCSWRAHVRNKHGEDV